MSTQKFLAKNSLLVVTLLGMSAVLGMVRESAVAYQFGTTAITDAYLIAMIIPLFFINLVKGAITSTYITVYSGYRQRDELEEGWQMTNVVLSALTIALSILVGLFYVFTPQLIHLVAPSYTGAQFSLTVELTRILLPSIVFGGLMGVMVGINNAHNSFLAPSLVGLTANVVTIVSIILLADWLGIYGLAIGSLLGIVAQFLIQIPSIYKHGWRFKFNLDLSMPGAREMMALVVPFVLASAAGQVNLIVDRTLATGLPEGSVSALYFASKLVFLPLNIFSSAIGMVAFPLLVRAMAVNDWDQVLEGLTRAIRLLALMILPAVVGIYILREPLVKLFFEHGAFTAENTKVTAGTVPYLLGALFFQAMNFILIKVYYAAKKMKVAVSITVITVSVNIGFSLLLVGPLQQNGLALANSLAALAGSVLLIGGLFVVLEMHKKTEVSLREQAAFWWRMALAVVTVSAAMWGYREWFGSVNGNLEVLFLSVSALTIGVIVFGATAYLLKVEEVTKGIRMVLGKDGKDNTVKEEAE